MADAVSYLNRPGEGEVWAERCAYRHRSRQRDGKCCGLPAWDGADDGEPRCEFHATPKPDDIRERLEAAVAAGHDLARARLSRLDLSRARLEGARLQEAHLAATDLTEAELAGASLVRADLSHAELCEANLLSADLGGADLSGADLMLATLSGAMLGGADLSGTNLFEADLTCAELEHAQVHSLTRIRRSDGDPQSLQGGDRAASLRAADLRGALLSGISLAPETELDAARFGPSPESPESCRILAEVEASGPMEFAECARVYRQLKLCCQESGDYSRAGDFFFREMHCMWRQKKARGDWRWRGGAFLQYLCGFGEQPLWAFGWMAAAVVLFGLIQSYVGIRETPTELQIAGGTIVIPPAWAMKGVELKVTPEGFWRAMKAMYFSLITFTTTGYGDLQPAPGLGRLLAGLEAALGMTLISLFLVCIVRKFSR